jgi:predicted SnoaL-like aldol condensation-catalyzing enzyme
MVDAGKGGSRKERALSFLRMVANADVRRAFDAHVSPHFRHHNPHFPGDALSLASAMEQNVAANPGQVLHIERAIEEGDLVAVHSRVRMGADAPDVALVHIFRFEGDRIAELWDIAQPPPAESPNEHGMF